MSFKVCALMASYNEEDIIEETIGKLINQGVDVYLIDNNSSDRTVELANKFLGKGLIKVETAIFYEDGKEIYNWIKILQRKESLSKELDYDWFLHTDADEIRYSPWPNMSLQAAFKLVDELGYNLVNFKLFDFRLTKSSSCTGSIEERLKYFAPRAVFNTKQVKAWKKCPEINLSHDGGHTALVKEPNLFPIRFILKHYPIRTIEQGIKKILKERRERYSRGEREMNWHCQYDHYSNSRKKIAQELLEHNSELREFCALEANVELTLECPKILALLKTLNSMNIETLEKEDYGTLPVTTEVSNALLDILPRLIVDARAGKDLDPRLNEQVKFTVDRLLKKAAVSEYLTGRVDLFENVSS